jgi:DNA-binding IclR family transcriptional regulator
MENSLEKMLRILDLIEENGRPLSSDDMLARLKFPRSTLYRYLKTLSAAGLISSFPNVGYALGPRVAELDYKMRLADPLITAARPVMAELAAAVPGIALLCRRYRDTVLCVHQEQGTAGFSSTYERGLARPLTAGAASRIILAYLPARTVGTLYKSRPKSFAEGGLGTSLEEAKATLKLLRQRGWDVTESQVTRGVTGIAAPIFDERGLVLGSLSITIGRTRLAEPEIAAIAERVSFCARIVSQAMRGSQSDRNPI